MTANGDRSTCEVVYNPIQVDSGTHLISAVYEGDPRHEPSLGTTTVKVSPPAQAPAPADATATAVGCVPASVVLGAASTCTATVTDTAGNPTAPGGTVNFASDGQGAFASASGCALTALSPNSSMCQVTYTASAIGSGNHRILAAYQGDAGHLRSEGATVLQVIAAPLAPNTKFKKKPKKKGSKRKVKFRFVSTQPGSHFECRLDKKKAFRPCRNPFKKKLKKGKHVLRVRAVNAQGVRDPSPAKYHWRVGKAPKRKHHK